MMKRVALYARVSSEEQVKFGYSLGAQMETLRQFAEKNGFRVIGEFVDEGISARKSYKKRPSLLRLLDEVQRDNVDLILFCKLDRWFRNVAAYYQVQPILDAHNVAWQAVLEDYETITSSGRMKVNIMLSVAENEADRTSERIKFVFDDKKSRGEPTSGKIPYGYMTVNKQLVPNPETAPIAQEIFQKYLDFRSIHDVLRWLWDEYQIPRNPSTIRRMLSNQRYLGSEFHPPLIDRETFKRAQELLESRAHRHVNPDKVYLFSGLMYCKDCGKRMKAYQPAKYEYYVCRSHADYGVYKCINKTTTRQDKLETYLLDNIVSVAEEHNAHIAVHSKPPKDKEKIRRKMQKLLDLYMNDLIDKAIYERDYKTLENELYEPEMPSRIIEIESLQETLKLYRSLSKTSQRAVWGRVLKRIEVDHDGNIFLIPN